MIKKKLTKQTAPQLGSDWTRLQRDPQIGWKEKRLLYYQTEGFGMSWGSQCSRMPDRTGPEHRSPTGSSRQHLRRRHRTDHLQTVPQQAEIQRAHLHHHRYLHRSRSWTVPRCWRALGNRMREIRAPSWQIDYHQQQLHRNFAGRLRVRRTNPHHRQVMHLLLSQTVPLGQKNNDTIFLKQDVSKVSREGKVKWCA